MSSTDPSSSSSSNNITANPAPPSEKKGRTYEEVHLTDDIIQRGVDLVAPLSRILLRRSKDVQVFHGRTTDSEWQAFEDEWGVRIPPDYKLLTNTVGTTGLWLNGQYQLTSPRGLSASLRRNQENYARWQFDGNAHEQVGLWPDQPAFHMEWGVDYVGNALSYHWVVGSPTKSKTKTNKANNNDNTRAGWPLVCMEMEAPMRHNMSVGLCTVTELLYRDVVGHNNFCDPYEDADDDDDDDDDFEKIFMPGNPTNDDDDDEEPMQRCVYQFDRNTKGEPPKRKAKLDVDNTNNALGAVGSEQDQKDMTLLQGGDIPTRGLDDCQAMAPYRAALVQECQAAK